jgi:hypothetical protein
MAYFRRQGSKGHESHERIVEEHQSVNDGILHVGIVSPKFLLNSEALTCRQQLALEHGIFFKSSPRAAPLRLATGEGRWQLASVRVRGPEIAAARTRGRTDTTRPLPSYLREQAQPSPFYGGERKESPGSKSISQVNLAFVLPSTVWEFLFKCSEIAAVRTTRRDEGTITTSKNELCREVE